MGEARRRQQTGTYPTQDDPQAALHRFWCRREPVAATVFVAPVGTIAITIDVENVAPCSCLLDAAKIMTVLDQVTAIARGMPYSSLVHAIAAQFTRAKLKGDDAALCGIGVAALWAAFHHPQGGAAMRQAVSDALRRDGKAHITWRFGPAGLAMALAERFVGIDHLASLAPQDRVTVYSDPAAGPKEPMH